MCAAGATDEQLLQSDDPEDFGTFYDRHVDEVLGFLMRRTRDAELAADLTAEVFAAALLARGRFDPAKGTAAQWLQGIVTRKLNHALRSLYAERKALKRLGIAPIALTDDDIERINALGSDVSTALADLPDEQRAAVSARVIDEADYVEIAHAQGISEATVRQRVSRGLGTLRRRLGG